MKISIKILHPTKQINNSNINLKFKFKSNYNKNNKMNKIIKILIMGNFRHLNLIKTHIFS